MDMGADALYSFPYTRGTTQLTLHFLPNFFGYLVWVILDILLVWIFVFLCLRMEDVEPEEPILLWGQPCPAMSRSTFTAALNITVFLFLVLSIVYDVASWYWILI